MPVTVKVADVASETVKTWDVDIDILDMDDFFITVYPKAIKENIFSRHTSYTLNGQCGRTGPSANGFFHSMYIAYNRHHHIRIRPDDIWIAIIVQFSNYVRAHHEQMRDQFVKHDGKKSAYVVSTAANRHAVDYANVAIHIGDMLRKSLVDESLYDWIMPCFSTTTDDDVAVASMVMMATLQDYFLHNLITMCGIPSVTLLGEREDYVALLDKLEIFSRFGDEVSQFSTLLKTILKEMIRSFDEPEAETISRFWASSILKYSERSGKMVFSGWMTAFCFWDKDGKCLYDVSWPGKDERDPLVMDGLTYQPIRTGDVPIGWCRLPLTVYDNGETVEAHLFAGTMGITCTSSDGSLNEDGSEFLDTVMPTPGWFYCEPEAPSDQVESTDKQ